MATASEPLVYAIAHFSMYVFISSDNISFWIVHLHFRDNWTCKCDREDERELFTARSRSIAIVGLSYYSNSLLLLLTDTRAKALKIFCKTRNKIDTSVCRLKYCCNVWILWFSFGHSQIKDKNKIHKRSLTSIVVDYYSVMANVLRVSCRSTDTVSLRLRNSFIERRAKATRVVILREGPDWTRWLQGDRPRLITLLATEVNQRELIKSSKEKK